MNDDPHPALSNQRVLVVEDERLIALDVQDILEEWGCIVLGPVASAEAALQLIADDPPDLAVLDVNLNDGTSEPVAAALRAMGLPFVVLTAYQRSHIGAALQDAPLLSKPVDDKKLKRELTALCSDALRG